MNKDSSLLGNEVVLTGKNLQCLCHLEHIFLRAQDYSSTYIRRTFSLESFPMFNMLCNHLQLLTEESAEESVLEWISHCLPFLRKSCRWQYFLELASLLVCQVQNITLV